MWRAPDRHPPPHGQLTDTSSTKTVPVPYQPCTQMRTLVDVVVLNVTDSLVYPLAFGVNVLVSPAAVVAPMNA